MSELVKMPSGKEYRLQQPTLAWRLFNLPLPENLAGDLNKPEEPAGKLIPEQIIKFARRIRTLLPIIFVEPRWSETPGAGLVTAADVSDEDLFFILRWESLGSGQEVSDPTTFRGQPAAPGAGGGPLEVPAI